MQIDNHLKTPLTKDQERAVQRIAEIAAARGWPFPGAGMVPITALELVERTMGGSRDELTIGFSGAGQRLILPRGAIEAAVDMMKKGKL